MKKDVEKLLLQAQKNEITEHYIYKRLADSVKDEHNKKVLLHISEDELKHYNVWKEHTKKEVKPSNFMFWKYYLISRILGLTFGLKLMEGKEEAAQDNYKEISKYIKKDAEKIERDEQRHEREILGMLDEEKLKYVGSIVLGLNDALVELTGALAGLTLALQNSQLIAMAGLITGIAASLSMSASEYLSTKSDAQENGLDKEGKSPIKASVYTGLAYIITIMFLIFPYLIVSNLYVSLVWMMANAIVVIFLFSFYVSVAKDINFKREFWGMALISFGVAVVSFGIGYVVRLVMGVEI